MFPRKVLLINKEFQLKFVGFFMAILTAGGLSLLGAINLFFSKFRGLGEALNLPPNHVFFTFVASQQSQLNTVLLLSLGVWLLLSFIGGLWLSNRVAGPIWRLCNSIDEQIATQKREPLTIRKGDFFQELPEKFNAYAEWIAKSQK